MNIDRREAMNLLLTAKTFFYEDKSLPTATPFQSRTFLLLIVVVCLLLILRQPDRLTHPAVVLEDGTIFFADAYNNGPFRSLWISYAGYYHLLPRFVASIGYYLPTITVALFYAVSTLLLTALACSWFYLPRFRHIIPQDKLRLVFCLLLPLLPNVEAIMVLAYVQWYVALWSLFVVLMPYPRHRLIQIGLLLAYCVAIGTVPVLIILLPIWVLRLLLAVEYSERVGIGLIIVAQLGVSLFTTYWLNLGNSIAPSFSPLLVQDITHGLIYKVFAVGLLGHYLAEKVLRDWGWFPLEILAMLTILCWLITMARAQAVRIRLISLLLFYLLISSVLFYGLRVTYYQYKFTNVSTATDHSMARYFLLGNVCLLLFIFVLLSNLLARRQTTRLRTLIMPSIICVPLVLSILYGQTLQIPPLPDLEWAKYAQLVTVWEKSPYTLKPLTVVSPIRRNEARLHHLYLPVLFAQSTLPANAFAVALPISPPGWVTSLYLSKDLPTIYQFPEGLTLLGIQQQQKGNQLLLTLFWQGNPLVDLGTQLHYTAYVHLVDSQQMRISGYDVELQPLAGQRLDAVFSTEHYLKMPSDFTPTKYNLVIGLYYLDHEALIDGSSILALATN